MPDIKGMPELLAKFKRLTEATQGRTLERAVVSGALIVQNDAKRNAPYLTGTLRRSIHIGGHSDQAGDFEGNDVGGNEADHDHAKVVIGTDLAYAARQEYGFIGADSLGRSYHQTPHPYLRPALENNESEIRREISAALKELIEAAAK